MRLEAILTVLAWLFILTGWLWIGVSVVMVVGAAWGAGKRRARRLFRVRDSRTVPEGTGPAEPNGNTWQKINPGQAPPPAGPIPEWCFRKHHDNLTLTLPGRLFAPFRRT